MSGDGEAEGIPASLEEVFASLADVGVPEGFLSSTDRAQGLPQERPEV
ncbi:MAG: hypothetical protein ABR976_03845 [Terracidiphilus sp.]